MENFGYVIIGIWALSITPLSPIVTIILLDSKTGLVRCLKHLLGRLVYYLLFTLLIFLFENIDGISIKSFARSLEENGYSNYIIYGLFTFFVYKVLFTDNKSKKNIIESFKLDKNAFISGILFSAIQARIMLLYLYGVLEVFNLKQIFSSNNLICFVLLFMGVIWHQVIIIIAGETIPNYHLLKIKAIFFKMKIPWKSILVVIYIACGILFFG